MAPIILRIKGTKLFSPFDNIDSSNDLSVIWRVCTKVKDSLENGSRLENLSWRLWHLQQMLEVQGKGNRLRRLIPETQKRFESNDKRQGFKPNKPLKIKVRISKQNEVQDESDLINRVEQSESFVEGSQKNDFSNNTNPKSQKKILPNNQGAGNTYDPLQNNPLVPTSIDTSSQQNLLQGSSCVSSPKFNLNQNSQFQLSQVASSSLNNNVTNVYDEGFSFKDHTQPTCPSMELPENHNVLRNGFDHKQKPNPVQASELMSFGPSSFLSNGMAFGQSQIEITLDDIFPNDSNVWDQSEMHQYNPFMSNSEDVYGNSVANMWGGGSVPGQNAISAIDNDLNPNKDFDFFSFDNSAPDFKNNQLKIGGDLLKNPDKSRMDFFSNNQGLVNHSMHNDSDIYPSCSNSSSIGAQSRNNSSLTDPSDLAPLAGRSDGPKCANCGTNNTPLWRRCGPDMLLCNACGLYYRLHNKHRSKTHSQSSNRKGHENPDQLLVCSNCQTSSTPLWRRDEDGSPLCNACGLYYKLHKEKRPISLKTDVIKKRHRSENNTGHTAKRSDNKKDVNSPSSDASVDPSEKSSNSTTLNIETHGKIGHQNGILTAEPKPAIISKLPNNFSSLNSGPAIAIKPEPISQFPDQVLPVQKISDFSNADSLRDGPIQRVSSNVAFSENPYTNDYNQSNPHYQNPCNLSSQNGNFTFSSEAGSRLSSSRSSFSNNESSIPPYFSSDPRRNTSLNEGSRERFQEDSTPGSDKKINRNAIFSGDFGGIQLNNQYNNIQTGNMPNFDSIHSRTNQQGNNHLPPMFNQPQNLDPSKKSRTGSSVFSIPVPGHSQIYGQNINPNGDLNVSPLGTEVVQTDPRHWN
ncbi:GATA-binding factor 5-B [Smittium mucronatum]|uniref:GATA-binding factor 5-B n=1 Tax=Smittium mucronatum TaxID=133383 RepID=A0A1R0GNH5_9FUNG|nr:GATA-binding factor 5-B [Smittium mucronatum]